MYDELIKRLRRCASYDPRFVIQDCEDAADAIEELSNIQIAPEKIIQTMWIPVTERLPDENDVVLITDSLDVGTGYLVHGYGWISPFDDIETSHVSHWMPLPQPPESEDE